MPQIIELPGPPPATKEERRAAAERTPDSAAMWQRSDTTRLIRMWDNVDQDWTNPVPREWANQYWLTLLVYRCSDCTFTTVYEGGVLSHVEQIRSSAKAHDKSKPVTFSNDRGTGLQCTGCGSTYRTMGKYESHLVRYRGVLEGDNHVAATEELIQRFTLRPESGNGRKPEPLPVTSQVLRSQRRATGRRRRGRRGRGGK
jgi:hypothetical protein